MYISDYGVNGIYIHVSEDLRLQEECHMSCSIVLNLIPLKWECLIELRSSYLHRKNS